tara:strand:+ start:348 stop:554 length:207 start_codon:yes stop_codon:yes gene_type:complete
MSEFIKAPKGAYNLAYEEVPTEDLWMDGELGRVDVISRIMTKVLDEGDWMLIRRTDRHTQELIDAGRL